MTMYLDATRFQKILIWAVLIVGPLEIIAAAIHWPILSDGGSSNETNELHLFFLHAQGWGLILVMLGGLSAAANALFHLVLLRWRPALRSVGIAVVLSFVFFATMILNPAITAG